VSARGPRLVVRHEPEHADRVVLLFLHAGAGPYALTGLVQLITAAAPASRVLAVTLAGREHLGGEPFDADPEQLIASVVAELPVENVPLVIVGVSCGALLALRAVCALRAAGRRCHAAVLAAQVPGNHDRPALNARTEAELARVLRAAGEIPAPLLDDLLDDEDLRGPLLARLGADLALGRRAAEGFGSLVLDIPLTVLGGLADGLVDPGLLAGWRRHTTAHCAVLLLSGGHLAFLDARHATVVSGALTSALLGNRATSAGAIAADGRDRVRVATTLSRA